MQLETWWNNLSRDWKQIICENVQEQQEYKLRTVISDIDEYIRNNLHLLTEITALNCSFSSIDSLEAIKELSSLEKIDCGDSSLRDIGALSYFPRLEKLDLMFCPDVFSIDAIYYLTGLRMVELSGTGIRSLHGLENKPYLHKLACIDTAVDSIKQLRGYLKLRELSISGTQVNDITPLFSNTHLKIISCRGCNIPQDQIKAYQKINPGCVISK